MKFVTLYALHGRVTEIKTVSKRCDMLQCKRVLKNTRKNGHIYCEWAKTKIKDEHKNRISNNEYEEKAFAHRHKRKNEK